MIEYTLAFVVDTAKEYVLLIRKGEGTWQSGLLNGLGGKLNENESPLHGIAREVAEESDLNDIKWEYLHVGEGKDWRIHAFYCTLPLDEMLRFRTKTSEPVNIYRIADLGNESLVRDVQWYIGLVMQRIPNDVLPS